METETVKAPEGALSDKELEARVAANQRRRAEKESGDGGAADEPRTGQALLNAAAKGKVTQEEAQSALDYFLASEDDAEAAPQVEPKVLSLNLGTKEKPRRVRWVILPVEDTEITRIRRTSQTGTRAAKRRGDADVDESAVARKIVARATVDPDLRELSRALESGPDPADAVHAFFARAGKTGLITQLSGEVLSISGWDDEDVQEVEAARG